MTNALTTNDIKKQENQKDKLPLNVLNNYFSIGTDAKIALDFHLGNYCFLF